MEAPITREDLERRFDAAIEAQPGADPFKPTEFGEGLLMQIVALVVRTAPPGEMATRAYAACEAWALDEITSDLRESVLRHVEAAVA